MLSGVYLTYCIRNAKKEIYKEKLTLSVSIYLETIVSLIIYVVKHSLWIHPGLNPDHLLLLYAIRCQLTVTPIIMILFMPKVSTPTPFIHTLIIVVLVQFFYKKPKRSLHHRSRHLSSAEVSDTIPDAINLYSAILSNGEIDIGEVNLSDMDPEDIRVSVMVTES